MTLPFDPEDAAASTELAPQSQSETQSEPSTEPLVVFARSGIEAQWEPLCGTLLGFARALGLDPNSSCSQGMCGCCATKILAGAVDYIDEPLHGEPKGKALLCYTVPSKSLNGGTLQLDM